MTTSGTRSPPDATSLAERGAALLPIALGIAVAVIRLVNSEPAGPAAGPLDPLAFAAVYSSPGLLALAAARRRPSLYLAAGQINTILAFTSFAGVTLPLLIPGGMALISFGRHAGEHRGKIADPLVAMICFVLGVASFVVPLVVHQDPRCVSIPGGESCSSDVVTVFEAAIALALVGATLLAGWFLAKPPPDA